MRSLSPSCRLPFVPRRPGAHHAEWRGAEEHQLLEHVPGVDRPRGHLVVHLGDRAAVHFLHDQEVRSHRVHHHHDDPADDLAHPVLLGVSDS